MEIKITPQYYIDTLSYRAKEIAIQQQSGIEHRKYTPRFGNELRFSFTKTSINDNINYPEFNSIDSDEKVLINKPYFFKPNESKKLFEFKFKDKK
jgi:hypothetical protein